MFTFRNGEEPTQFCSKIDVILLSVVFEIFINVSNEEFDFSPLYCVSLPGYTWQSGMKCTNISLQTLQDRNLILLLGNVITGGISSVLGDGYAK